MSQLRRIALGTAVALVGIGLCTAVMMAFRPHLSSPTTALVLVMPVVAGVAVGGLPAGVISAGMGFLAYDVAFVKPYGTLMVGVAQDWIALVVYVVVVVLVARLVAHLEAARRDARRREDEARRLNMLVERLIADRPLPDLLKEVLDIVAETFHPRWAAILLPRGQHLEVTATAGEPLTPDEHHMLAADPHRLHTLAVSSLGRGGIVSVALSVQDRPVGMLALSDVHLAADDGQLLRAYANQAAHAIERSQLRDMVLRTEMLEASDRWRRALLGAVSHDLRTPLATIKAAVTAARDSQNHLSPVDRDELLALIEDQSDNLARMVTNLLDFTRIQSGSLRLEREPTSVEDIVAAASSALGDGVREPPVVTKIPADLPPVDIDDLLMVQVVANLLENAARHSPPGVPIEVEASLDDGVVSLAIRDRGPGVPFDQRERIFEMWTTSEGGRAGLGLGIAKAFVEAHGQSISLRTAPADSGAEFVVTMPPTETADLPRITG